MLASQTLKSPENRPGSIVVNPSSISTPPRGPRRRSRSFDAYASRDRGGEDADEGILAIDALGLQIKPVQLATYRTGRTKRIYIARPSDQPFWIRIPKRGIGYVGVSVQASAEAERVALNVPAEVRPIVTVAVVVKVSLLVRILPRES